MRLEITIDLYITWDDEDLQKIVTAWSNLHTLRLHDRSCPVWPMPSPGITFDGLCCLASQLPLKEIMLCVDLEKLPKYSKTNPIISCPTLRHLDLCVSPITPNTDRIVTRFTRAFPSLSRLSNTFGPLIYDGYNPVDVYRVRWQAVERRLKSIMAENQHLEYCSY